MRERFCLSVLLCYNCLYSLKSKRSVEVVKKILRRISFLSLMSHSRRFRRTFILPEICDTLLANRDTCVGLAANIFWWCRSAIIFNLGLVPVVMFNPVLLSFEGSSMRQKVSVCPWYVWSTLSDETTRLAYRDSKWQEQTITLTGFPAQICQHELDHLEGRII